MLIQPISEPTRNAFQPLLDASSAEGYKFVQRLWDEYQSGINRFDTLGALLLGGYDDAHLVAVGGVHRDPYLNDPTIGRIRHVYVLPAYRRSGVGRVVVQALMQRSSNQFSTFTLRTLTGHGDRFYRALGFSSVPRFEQATHWLDIRSEV